MNDNGSCTPTMMLMAAVMMLMIPSRHTDRVSSCKQWPISIRLRSYEWSALSKVQSHRSGCLPSTKTIRVHIPLRPQLYCKMSCQRMGKKLLLAHIYLKYNSDQQIHLQTLYCHCAVFYHQLPYLGFCQSSGQHCSTS